MLYMLCVYSDQNELASLPEPEIGRRMGAYEAYARALDEAGVIVGSNRLRPATTATTIRVRDGRTQVLDGPYAETKEQLGGYFLIDVPDLDAAISWAARCPGALYGAMEVRPIWQM